MTVMADYELYYELAEKYASTNINQAYLCYENAEFLYMAESGGENIGGINVGQDIDIKGSLDAKNGIGTKKDISIEDIRQKKLSIMRLPEFGVRKTSFVIVSYNSMYLMQKCIESIRTYCNPDTYEIVVLDNASTDGVREWLCEQDDIKAILVDENVGFPTGCNIGAQYCEPEYDIFLLNNDTRITPNALFWLRMGLYESDDIGAVGGCSNYAGNRQQLDVEYELPSDYVSYGKTVNIPLDEPYEERVRLSGFAMLIRRGVWDITGGMDEDFSPGYFEDDDLCIRISRAGYRMLFCRNAFIYHAGSQSFAARDDVNSLLEEHRQLFIDKYGFDIMDYAYADEELIGSLPYSGRDSFKLLQIGSGLGTELKSLRTRFPNATVVGVETDKRLYDISKCTDTVFGSVGGLKEIFRRPFFNVLLLDRKKNPNIAREELGIIMSVCRNNCIILPKPDKYAYIPYGDIKLVIWDMDDTFWTGTLSEGEVAPSERNVRLIKDMTDCGIVNSISSKNDRSDVETELKKLDIWEYFVFSDINWENKGEQIKKKIADMNLRPENVLFIDDNPRNLEEAAYYNQGLMTASPEVADGLAAYVKGLAKSDTEHKRLKQYKVLEEKRKAMEAASSNEQFLYESDIKLTVRDDCMDRLDRIAELVLRTNQLNFTKRRSTKEELAALINDDDNLCGYVEVSDRFGDYGIVGFYCYNQAKKELVHFLFSCRVMGMGIEQCVYVLLGLPEFDVVQPVSGTLDKTSDAPWIYVDIQTGSNRQGQEKAGGYDRRDADNENGTSAGRDADRLNDRYFVGCDFGESNVGFARHDVDGLNVRRGTGSVNGRHTGTGRGTGGGRRVRVLLKGPCDMDAIAGYLIGGDVTKEFNFVNDKGFITAGQNHSVHIMESIEYSPRQIGEFLESAPFITAGDFETSLFSREYDIICYSLLPDCHAGLYRNKKNGFCISFGSRNFDLTALDNMQGYIDGTIVNHAFPFTEQIIRTFADEWEYVGATGGETLINNLDYMVKHAPGSPAFILLLGSEIEYEGKNDEFAGHGEHHKKINAIVKEYAKRNDRVKIIEMTDFIHSQSDYYDSINHFSRNVYYEMAAKVCGCINEAAGARRKNEKD